MSDFIIIIRDGEVIIQRYKGTKVVKETIVPCPAPNHISVKLERPIRIYPPEDKKLQVGPEGTEYLKGVSVPICLLDPKKSKT